MAYLEDLRILLTMKLDLKHFIRNNVEIHNLR